MGLIQAAAGAIGGTLADQWKDFYTIPTHINSTTALVSAEKRGTDRSRGSNTSASLSVITKGSKFVVPEGYGLILRKTSIRTTGEIRITTRIIEQQVWVTLGDLLG